MGTIADEMKKVVVDIKTSFGERRDFVANLIDQEKNRQKEAKRDTSQRKRDFKVFVGDVNSFLGQIKDDLDESHCLWQNLSKSHVEPNGRKKKRKK